MFDAEQVTKTTQRYESRTSERAGAEAKIESGAILQADTPRRVRLRLMRKGIAPAQAEELLSDEAVSFGQVDAVAAIVPPAAVNALERIIGAVDLINASFLTNGARASRAVCRIVIGEPDGLDSLVIGFGTGVMVSPRLLLTNNHVLESPALAAASHAEFGYEEDGDGQIQPSVQFALAPDTLFLTDPELDYTLVAVDPTASDGRALSDFGWVPLIAQEGKIIKGELVNIIQHPNGEPKRVALRENQVVDLLENFMHYKTDTAPGSSGAPVFNDEWEMVALHHSGVPARDPNGNILAIDGSPWGEEMGEHRVKWVANEGARVSRLVARLRAQIDQQGGSGTQRRLLDEALAGIAGPQAVEIPDGALPGMGIVTRTSPPAPAVDNRPLSTGATEVAADGTVTWTIPIQLSVRLGTPAPGAPPSVPDRPPRTETPPVVTTRPAPTAAPSARLQSALAELERARQLPYYDARADKTARTNYYRGLSRRRSSRAFFAALSELVTRTHNTVLPYDPAQHVYPWVDLRPNSKLRSIYTGDEYEPEEIIRADIEVRESLTARLRERFGTESLIPQETLVLLEAQLPYNCEHVVPQSWFGERQPMRGDLHHLFTCESTCNSFRGRKSYFEFTDFEEVIRDGCGKRVENQFEPNHGKGEVARATFYFLLRYPGQINRRADEYEEERLAMLLEWHRQEPVSEYERHRNAAAFAKQGNRNPLIDFPDWADRIDFTPALGPP